MAVNPTSGQMWFGGPTGPLATTPYTPYSPGAPSVSMAGGLPVQYDVGPLEQTTAQTVSVTPNNPGTVNAGANVGGMPSWGPALASGVMGFLGGMYNRPAMIGRGITIGLEMQQQQATQRLVQQAETFRENLVKEIDWSNPDSIGKAGNKALAAGFDKYANELFDREKEKREVIEADRSTQYQYIQPEYEDTKNKVWKYNLVQERIDQAGGVKQLSPQEAGAIVLEYARSVNPEAVNDSDYERLVMTAGASWKDFIRQISSLIPGAAGPEFVTPAAAVQNIQKAMEVNAINAINALEALSAGMDLQLPNLRGLLPRADVTPRRANRLSDTLLPE